jgi:hypothetical protein
VVQDGDTCESGVVRVRLVSGWGEVALKSDISAGFRIEAGEPRVVTPRPPRTTDTARVDDKKPDLVKPVPQEEPKAPAREIAFFKYMKTESKEQGSVAWSQLNGAYVPPLHVGDAFWFEFTPEKSKHLYIYRYDTLINLERLFPLDADPTVTNPLPAGSLVNVPGKDSPMQGMFLLPEMQASEKVQQGLLVVLSDSPRDDLDERLRAFKRKEPNVYKKDMVQDLIEFVNLARSAREGSETKRFNFDHLPATAEVEGESK